MRFKGPYNGPCKQTPTECSSDGRSDGGGGPVLGGVAGIFWEEWIHIVILKPITVNPRTLGFERLQRQY